jgi:alanyl-tRNA synthetase
VTCQKVFRALDIDNVGHTARHLTFFEMLGNFAFGDYFKRESCGWGYELVTQGWGIDPDRLWVTVFETDDEAIDVWLDIGMPRDRIVRRGKDDNFWWTHAAGPAGPCSEIYVDRGARYGREGGPEADEERHVEIWNHVFMQDEVDEHQSILRELPAKNIDTGASLERVAMVLQDVDDIFATDLVRPLLEVAESISGRTHGRDERDDVSLKVIAEHGRATTFLIADGVQPSNEGRGYILRRMLRRVVSHARRLGIETDVMPAVVGRTVELFGDAYPELVENRAYAEQVAASEEERFGATLRQGMTVFEEEVGRSGEGGRLTGDAVFKLHDTYGFPKELTRELAEDAGLEIDEARFEALMEEQRERAKRAAKRGRAEEELAAIASDAGRTEFVGYEALEAPARLVAILGDDGRIVAAGEGAEVRFVLDRSPFYAEAGGQVGDQGIVRGPGGTIRVVDAQVGPGDLIVHAGVVDAGEIREGEEVHGEVEAERREATARAHTATHIVHWTLKHLLGEHARQAGSLVAPGRLRFDFPHHSAVGWDTLEQAEEIANAKTTSDDQVTIYETTFDEAKNQGAVALFGERYGDFVRVVEVGDYSVELCGGTHVHHTGHVGTVRMLHEGSIGAGMRRVEAVVGAEALREINVERAWLRAVAEALGTDPSGALERARQLVDRVKRLETEQGKKDKERQRERATEIAATARDVAGARLIVRAEDLPADGLRALAQDLANRLEDGSGAAVVLGSAQGGKALLVAACSTNLQARGVSAPELLGPAAKLVGGGAGGKPGLAFSGGPRGEATDLALEAIEPRLRELLGER